MTRSRLSWPERSIEVHFERFSADGLPLRAQASEARSLASAHDALGVFWLDTATDRDWLVYLTERSADRVLVRRVTVESGGSDAAIEAVSVITRQSSEALVSGETIGMRPVALPPEPTLGVPGIAREPIPMPRPPAFVRPRGLALGAAYAGDSPSVQIGWQSGVRLAAAYRSPIGLYAGVGYVLYGASLLNEVGLAFQVARHPVDIDIGYSFGRGRVTPSVELRGMIDVLRREDVAAEPPYDGVGNDTRALVFLSPRVRLGYTLSSVSEVYVMGGADVAINDFSYVSRGDGGDHVLLALREVRPAIEVGCFFWP